MVIAHNLAPPLTRTPASVFASASSEQNLCGVGIKAHIFPRHYTSCFIFIFIFVTPTFIAMAEQTAECRKAEVLWPITATTVRMVSLSTSLESVDIFLQPHAGETILMRYKNGTSGTGPDTNITVSIPAVYAYPCSLLSKKFTFLQKLMEILNSIPEPTAQSARNKWALILDGTRRSFWHHYKVTRMVMEHIARDRPHSEDPLVPFLQRWLWQEFSSYNCHHPDAYQSNTVSNTEGLDVGSAGKNSSP